MLKKASENAKKKKLEVTDEAMLLEAINQKITYVKADESNFKITTQADYERLKSVLGDLPEDFRVGIGQDSHVFEEEKNCS
ncbi:MAG: 2-C-methyl-D-erythritol 4-phosphate cytidylyltransferase [Patescibacteria group bacterium]